MSTRGIDNRTQTKIYKHKIKNVIPILSFLGEMIAKLERRRKLYHKEKIGGFSLKVFLLSCPEVTKLFPCSTQLSTKFILLINVKMPTIVGILTVMSMINTTSERLEARNFFICWYFSFHRN